MRPLSRHELQVGSALAQAVYDREGKLLLEAGHVLRSDAQCESLVARGYVREAEMQRRSSSAGLGTPPAGLAASGLAASGPRAWPARVGPGILRLRDELRALLPRLLQPDSGDAGQRLCELREPLLRYLRQDADAALAYMQLSAREDGQAARPIHAALLMGLMAQTLALDEVELQSLLGAALSFDCALAPLARVLNDQRAELTPSAARWPSKPPASPMPCGCRPCASTTNDSTAVATPAANAVKRSAGAPACWPWSTPIAR